MVHVAIFDYGAGNIFSLKRSLERQGAAVDVITDAGAISRYSGLLLPGVGNFDPAIKKIAGSSAPSNTVGQDQGTLDKAKTDVDPSGVETGRSAIADTDVPVLGICLGMEMFFEDSQEGVEKGLSIMGGSVDILPPSLKVPHMGWNDLMIRRPGRLLEEVDDGTWVYFVHSYWAVPTSYNDVVTAESDYGVRVPAVVEKDNFFGTQFHPEKSGPAGKTIIGNFLGICKR